MLVTQTPHKAQAPHIHSKKGHKDTKQVTGYNQNQCLGGCSPSDKGEAVFAFDPLGKQLSRPSEQHNSLPTLQNETTPLESARVYD